MKIDRGSLLALLAIVLVTAIAGAMLVAMFHISATGRPL